MILLKAADVVSSMRGKLIPRVTEFKTRTGRTPKLAVVLVGEDPASVIYTGKKGEAAVAAGFLHETHRLPASSSAAEVKARVAKLNADPSVDGILIQRPLPRGFDEAEVSLWVSPKKDVDVFHPQNVGQMVLGTGQLAPCTPAGVMKLLEYYSIPVAGKTACVIGRSSIVGKPMATLLLQANATLIHCHSHTRNLGDFTRQADILVVAAGKPLLINKDHVKQGAAVIDVGMHRTQDGKLCGDVDFESVKTVAGALTPVPGGVGPMTIALLLENTLIAAGI